MVRLQYLLMSIQKGCAREIGYTSVHKKIPQVCGIYYKINYLFNIAAALQHIF